MNAEELTGQESGFHNTKPITDEELLVSMQFEYRLLAAKVLMFYLQEKGFKERALAKVIAENDGSPIRKQKVTWARHAYNNLTDFERTPWCKFYSELAGVPFNELEEWVKDGNYTRQKKRKVARMGRTEINH